MAATYRGQEPFQGREGPKLVITAEKDAATPCFVDCDESGTLDIQDFTCFQNAFALGDLAHADCNGDSVLDIQDFTCFQNGFALGCP